MNIFQNFAAIKQLVDEIWITRSLAITPRNWLEFYFQYKDIFYSREYHFVARSQNPFIIDCGANIGVSIAYFKKIYPKCRILAFEPNPVTFQLLRQNMKRNRFKNVKLIEAALDSHGGKATLYSDSRSWWNGSWADSIQAHKSQHAAYEVKTIALSPYITQTVDLLKLDIEGMEGAVFSEIAPKLQYVKEIIFEYHGPGKEVIRTIGAIRHLLKRAGFSCTYMQHGQKVTAAYISAHPDDYFLIHAVR